MPNNKSSLLSNSADDLVQAALKQRGDILNASANNVKKWEDAVDTDAWEHEADDFGITTAAKGVFNLFANGVKNALPRNARGDIDFSKNVFKDSNFGRNIRAQYGDNKLNNRSSMHNMGWKIADPALEALTWAAIGAPGATAKAFGKVTKGVLGVSKGIGNKAVKPLLKRPSTYVIGGLGALSGYGQREVKREEAGWYQPEENDYTEEKTTQYSSFSDVIKNNPNIVNMALAAAPALIGYGVGGGRGALIGGTLGLGLTAAKNYLEKPVDRDVKFFSPSTWKYIYQDPIENYKRRQIIKSINDFVGTDLFQQR